MSNKNNYPVNIVDENGGYYDEYGGYYYADGSYLTYDGYHLTREEVLAQTKNDYQDDYENEIYYEDDFKNAKPNKKVKKGWFKKIVMLVVAVVIGFIGFLFLSGGSGGGPLTVITSNDYQKLLVEDLTKDIEGVLVKSLNDDYLYGETPITNEDIQVLNGAKYLVIQSKELDAKLVDKLEEASKEGSFSFEVIELNKESEVNILKDTDNKIDVLQLKINQHIGGVKDPNSEPKGDYSDDEVYNKSLFKELKLDKFRASDVSQLLKEADFPELYKYMDKKEDKPDFNLFRFQNPVNKSIFTIEFIEGSTKEFKFVSVELENGDLIDKASDHRYPDPTKGPYKEIEGEGIVEEEIIEDVEDEPKIEGVSFKNDYKIQYTNDLTEKEIDTGVASGFYSDYSSYNAVIRDTEVLYNFFEEKLNGKDLSTLKSNKELLDSTISKIKTTRTQAFTSLKNPMLIYLGSGDVQGLTDWFQIKPDVVSGIDSVDLNGERNIVYILDYILNFPESVVLIDKSTSKELVNKIKYSAPDVRLIELNTSMSGSTYGFTASLELVLDQIVDGVEAY